MLRIQRLALAPFLLVLLLHSSMTVAAGTTPSPINIAIPAQPLEQALNAWASQTGYRILWSDEKGIATLMAPKVDGSLTPEAALQQLLARTGLTYQFVDAKSVAIHVLGANSPSATSSENALSNALHMAQADSVGRSNAIQVAASVTDSDAIAKEPLDEVRLNIPEILVQGTRSLNTDIKRSRDDIQPHIIFNRAEIERSGATDIHDFLQRQLSASVTSSANIQNPTNAFRGNTSVIDLRGLGPEQTLVLIDGHRAVSVGLGGIAGQPDLNGIPLSAVERIEVLPTTASGIYGGGATGGVVNVVLRRDYAGMETKLTYGSSFSGGAATRRVDVSAGFDLEGGKTNVLIAGSYSDADPLLMQDRDLLQRARAHALANNPTVFQGSNPPLGTTTNIASVPNFTFVPDGTPGADCSLGPGFCFIMEAPKLTLKSAFGGGTLGSTFTSVPQGYAGPQSDNGGGLISNAGTFNFGLANTAQVDGGGRQALLQSPKVESIVTTIRRDFTSRLQAFLELAASNNSSRAERNTVFSTFFLPASAASNPFDQNILVTTPALGADQTLNNKTYNRRVVGGVIVRLPHDWQGGVDYTWNRNRTATSDPSNGLSPAATTDIESGALNLFRDTNAAPTDFSPYLVPPGGYAPSSTLLRDATLRLSGPLRWRLPGGQPILSMLIEHRKEVLNNSVLIDRNAAFPPETATNLVTSYGRSQSTDSAYLESRIPVISAQNRIPAIELLEFQLAGRWDDYTTVGANNSFSLSPTPIDSRRNNLSSVDPTVGMRYQPVRDIMVRASFGTGFLPPQVSQLTNTTEVATPAAGYTDPRRNNEPVGALNGTFDIVSGGNPDLRPEQSRSKSAGLIITPRFVPGLRMSVDWTRINKTDNISSDFEFGPDIQMNINREFSIPGFVERGAETGDGLPGPIVKINAILFNIARQQVEAYDLALDYRMNPTRFGTFSFSSSATRAMHNLTQIIPSLPITENVETETGGVKWRGNASLVWDYNRWSLAWSTQYYHSYYLSLDHSVNETQGSATIPSQVYHNFFASRHFESPFQGKWIKGGDIQLGVRNVFNKEPPVLALGAVLTSPYAGYGDPRLANYYLSVRTSF